MLRCAEQGSGGAAIGGFVHPVSGQANRFK
jgi:hypothetical protein